MTEFSWDTAAVSELDAFEIERQARIAQSRYVAASIRSLFRRVAARLHLSPAAHTA